MKIPYGDSDFGRIRSEGYYYVDKTPFLPVLERQPRFLVLLRPRRFGKSTLISMMEHYYDIGQKDRFEALFKGLWVYDHPTPEKNKYLVLRLDFSSVSTDGGEADLKASFAESVRTSVRTFILRYRARIPEIGDQYQHLESRRNADDTVAAVMSTTDPQSRYRHRRRVAPVRHRGLAHHAR